MLEQSHEEEEAKIVKEILALEDEAQACWILC